jgi:hypothetical protein
MIEKRIRECELVRKTHSALNLSIHQNGGRPNTGIPEMVDTLAWLKSEYYAVMNKYPETASVVQEVYKVLSDVENIAGCTPAKVGESSE